MSGNKMLRAAAAVLCAAMLLPAGGTAFAGPDAVRVLQQAESARPTEKEILYGAHMGYTDTGLGWDIGSNYPAEARVDYVTGNLYVKLNAGNTFYKVAYNSQDTDTTILGNSFTCNYTQTLKPYQKGSDDVLVYTDEYGKKEYLEKTMDADGTTWWGSFALQPNGDRSGGYYQIFDELGRVQQISIPHLAYQELMHFTYNPLGLLIQTVGQVEGQGFASESRLYYTLIGDMQLPLVTRMVNTGMLDMRFDYDGDGNMTVYQVGNAAPLELMYESGSSRISYILDTVSNQSMTFGYTLHDGCYKVSFVKKTDAMGNILDQTQFAYGNGQTVIIDKDGNATVKTY